MVAVRARPGASTRDDADLAQRAKDGEAASFGELFERWFDRAFDVAWHIVRNRDTAAEVTQEAFAVAWHQISELRQPASFGGWLLRIARNKSLSRLARDRRTSLVGDDEDMEAIGPRAGAADAVDRMIERERDDLVWVASAVLGPDDASLLSLHLRHELGAADLAGELGIQANAVHQRLFRLKRRLGDAIGAWVLWRGGEPACPRLRAELEDVDGTRFSRPTAAAIGTHARRCGDCERNRALQLSPEALFCAVPIVAAGPVVRAEAAAALEGIGVPTGRAGHVLDGTPPDRTGGRGGRGGRGGQSWLRTAAMAAGAAAAVVAGVVAVAERAGDGSDGTAVETAPDERDAAATAVTDPGPSGSSSGGPGPTGTTTSIEPSDGSGPVAPDPGPAGQSATTTTMPPSPPTPPSPAIGAFEIVPGTGACPTGQARVTLGWSSTGATAATLGPVGGSADDVPPSGNVTRCSPPGTTWELTVTGPAGSATDTATAPPAG